MVLLVRTMVLLVRTMSDYQPSDYQRPRFQRSVIYCMQVVQTRQFYPKITFLIIGTSDYQQRPALADNWTLSVLHHIIELHVRKRV